MGKKFPKLGDDGGDVAHHINPIYRILYSSWRNVTPLNCIDVAEIDVLVAEGHDCPFS
jgi:hypothetical protein